MVRQTTDPASPFYAILAYPNDSPRTCKVRYRSPLAKNPIVLAKVYPPRCR